MTEPCDPTGHPWQTYCSVHDSWRIVGADCWVARAEKAEATIQRVRDACVSSHVDDKGKKVVFLDRIQRALDGAE